MSSSISRYSDVELAEFKFILEDKLEKAKKQYENLIEQIKEITENSSGDFTKDLTDFSSSQTEVEMLNTMATRQRSYIQDLQNALIRIRNRSYGICVVTGVLIDKIRLTAVPTTTKSVIAKQMGETQTNAAMLAAARSRSIDADDEEGDDVKKKRAEPRKAVIISKVIKKPSEAKPTAKKPIDDDDDDLDEILKDLDGFEEETEVAFDDDLDVADDSSDDFEDSFDEADMDEGDDD
jgi:RNA polymerase-binding transcription factor DksA